MALPGPAGLLKKGTTWLDAKVVFATKDDDLAAAAMMVWKISKQIRIKQGELRLSSSDLAFKAKITRQTATNIAMGTTWPDARTLGLLCSVLGLEITAILAE